MALGTLLCVGAADASAASRFGLRAGMNVNDLNISGDVMKNFDVSNRAGLVAGVMWESNSSAGFAIELGAMYRRTSAEVNNIDWSAVSQDTWNTLRNQDTSMDFVELPLHLKYRLDLPLVGSIVRPIAFTGPSASFKFNDAQTLFATKKWLLGWDMGLGVELVKHLQLSAQYSMELNDFLDQAETATNLNFGRDPEQSGNAEVKGHFNYWTVTATYFF